MIIGRGIIYHSLIDDFKNLIRSFFLNLKNKNKIKNFELAFKKYNRSKYCISYPFARSAFWSILKSSSLKEGDEIILPSIQIKGMLEVCKFMKLKPIIVDLDKNNLSFDIKDLKKKINENTRVILLTYLYGIVPNVEKLLKILANKNIIIVEDFSQCLFGKYKNKYVGNFGDYGIYSLSATKTLDTYGGGLLVTNNKINFLKNLAIKSKIFKNYSRFFLIKKIFISLLRNFFILKINYFFIINIFKILNLFKIEKYKRFLGARDKILLKKPPKIWFQSYTSLQAEHGIKFINKVKKENIIRQSNVNFLKKGIGKKFFCKDEKLSQNVYWQCAFFSDNYKIIQDKLIYKNIDVAQPSIMLLTSIFDLKNFKANKIYEKLLFIPCYHTLKKLELIKMISIIKKYV